MNVKMYLMCFIMLHGLTIFSSQNQFDHTLQLLQNQIETEFGGPGRKVTSKQLENLAEWIVENLATQSKTQPVLHYLLDRFFFSPLEYHFEKNLDWLLISLFCLDVQFPLSGIDENGNTIVHSLINRLINQDDVFIVISLLKKFVFWGASLQVKNNNGDTPLNLLMDAYEWYRLEQELEVAELLLRAGAQVSTNNRQGVTPMDKAVKNQRIRTVNFLKAYGAKPTDTTLTVALDGFNPAIINCILNDIPISRVTTAKKLSKLHAAVIAGDVKKALEALHKNPDKNVYDTWGRTPLHWAALLGHEKLVQILLEYGFDPLQSDSSMYALNSFEWAIFNGHTSIVTIFLSKNVPLNKQNTRGMYGNRPLHLAVYHPAIADLLIKKGADVTLTNNFNQTALGFLNYLLAVVGEPSIFKYPIHALTWHEQQELVYTLLEVLKKHSARVDFEDFCLEYNVPHQLRGSIWDTNHLISDRAQDLAFIAVQWGVPLTVFIDDFSRETQDEAEQRIKEEFSRFNWLDKQKNEWCYKNLNDFLYSAVIGDLKTFKKLLPKFSVNFHGCGGMTPLHWAAARGHIDLVRFLLQHGADKLSVDEHQKTALDYARLNGHKSIVSLLK